MKQEMKNKSHNHLDFFVLLMIEDLSNKNLSSLSFVLLSRNKNEKET